MKLQLKRTYLLNETVIVLLMDKGEEQKEEQGFKNLEDVTQIHKLWEEERVKWLTVSRTPL